MIIRDNPLRIRIDKSLTDPRPTIAFDENNDDFGDIGLGLTDDTTVVTYSIKVPLNMNTTFS